MARTSGSKQQSAFSHWLRTGRLPSDGTPDGVEVKFNPWHDPQDGRFTFAGSGNYHGAGAGRAVYRASGISGRDTPRKQLTAAAPTAAAPQRAHIARSGIRQGSGQGPKPTASLPGTKPNPAAELIGGVGEGLYSVVEGAAEAVRSAVTTNPVTTVRNIGRGIASGIDAAIAAEDTPARTQVSRAADAVANASPRQIGRAVGSVVGNAALSAVPGAALGKVATARRFGRNTPPINYDPPKFGWVRENLGPEKLWTQYNNSATGSRAGLAPTIMRTMPDGSKRPVKFDGVEQEYLIDRKWRVVNAPRARAQLKRQSEALAEHGLTAVWEVPNDMERITALKLFKQMNVTNIRVRVVKP